MSTYLGIDYGKSHVGLALASGPLSSPLSELKNTPNLISNLGILVAEHHVTHIVCGLPEGSLEAEIKVFAAKLQEQLGVTVTLHPETLSTVEAQEALRFTGAGRKKRQNEHVYAACLILDDYLELHHAS